MGRKGSGGISLRGAAAMAFVNGAAGKDIRTGKPLDEKGKYLALATKVHLLMAGGGKEGPDIAAALLAQLEKQGLELTYETHGR